MSDYDKIANLEEAIAAKYAKRDGAVK